MNLTSNKIDNSCCSADEILLSFQVLLAAVFTQKEKTEHLYKLLVALFVEECVLFCPVTKHLCVTDGLQ